MKIQDADDRTWKWLCKEHLKRETESILAATVNKCINTGKIRSEKNENSAENVESAELKR